MISHTVHSSKLLQGAHVCSVTMLANCRKNLALGKDCEKECLCSLDPGDDAIPFQPIPDFYKCMTNTRTMHLATDIVQAFFGLPSVRVLRGLHVGLDYPMSLGHVPPTFFKCHQAQLLYMCSKRGCSPAVLDPSQMCQKVRLQS